MTFSMILTDKMVKSSNHHDLLDVDGLIDSSVDKDNRKPNAVLDEDEEEATRLTSGF